MQITYTTFGKTADGRTVLLFTLTNDNNVTVKITNYGGIITSITMPDKNGVTGETACGFDNFDDYISEAYLGNYPYFGCIIGRCGNRIGQGKFTIDGIDYPVALNNGNAHLHGGNIGFDKRLWESEMIEENDKVALKLSYLSPHMEEGYPGNLRVSCLYALDNDNNLTLHYEAETDKPTIVNLTNHTYFNLTGGKNDIMGHDLLLAGKKYTELKNLVPTGKIIDVKGTPYDFTVKKSIGRDIGALDDGFDINYVLDNEGGNLLEIGSLSESSTGREVKIFTTQPGVQLYTGYWIPELTIGGVKKFGRFSGVALETQHFPDAPHHPHFPSTILRPGEKYDQTTIYRFITNKD